MTNIIYPLGARKHQVLFEDKSFIIVFVRYYSRYDPQMSYQLERKTLFGVMIIKKRIKPSCGYAIVNRTGKEIEYLGRIRITLPNYIIKKALSLWKMHRLFDLE
jgi:hypothetical protein